MTQAAHRRWGKPILFHNVSGTKLPVLTNIYGIARASGRDHRHRAAAISAAMEQTSRHRAVAATLQAAVPAPSRIRMSTAKLSDLPLLTYSERDAAPYFTSAMFLAREPETGVRNLSFHRSMYVSDEELRCRLAPRHHLTLYHEKAEQMGRTSRRRC